MARSVNFQIRHLGPADVALAQAMITVLGEAFRDPETYMGARPSTEYLERVLGGSHVIALAALRDDEVVGGLVAYELQKLERERSEIYIYDLAVSDAYRRQGIATRLIEELKTLAAKRNAYIIFVQADLPDAPAISLYTKLGAREEVLHFDIAI